MFLTIRFIPSLRVYIANPCILTLSVCFDTGLHDGGNYVTDSAFGILMMASFEGFGCVDEPLMDVRQDSNPV